MDLIECLINLMNEDLDLDLIDPNFTFAGLKTDRYIDYLNKCIKLNGSRRLKDGKRTGMIHTHHIWPTSLGGGDDESNMLDLKFYQHRDAHKILALDNPTDYKCQSAALELGYDEDGNVIKTQDYRKILSNHAKLSSIMQSANNSNKGNHLSDDSKKVLSDKNSKNQDQAQKVIVKFDDGTEKIFDSQVAAGEDLFPNYANKYQVVHQIIKGKRKAPLGIISIEYLDPESVDTNENQERPVIGINIDTGEQLKFPSSRSAAAYLIDNGYVLGNFKSDATKKASVAGKISASATNNRSNNESDFEKLTYKTNWNHCWLDADANPQLIGWIKRHIKKYQEYKDKNNV